LPRPCKPTAKLLRQLMGVRYSTSLKTRLDKANLNATALDIAVSQAATIEIRRDGELLDIQQVSPGQRQLDTDRLPRGAYAVDLIIREGGDTRTETRYFTTSSGLPPSDTPQWYVEVGTALPIGAQNGWIPTGETPILAVGRHQRMGSNWVVRVDATLTDQILFLEAGAHIRTRKVSGSASVLTSGTGTRGISVSGTTNQGRWQLNGSYRHLGLGLQTLSLSAREYNPFPSGFRQASLTANRSAAWGRIGVRGFYFENDTGGENWFAGPFADLAILGRDRWRVNLLLRQEWASNRTNSFIGLRLSSALNRPPQFLSNARLSARLDAFRSEPRRRGDVQQNIVSEATMSADLLRAKFNRVSSYVRVRDEEDLGAQIGLSLSTPAVEARVEGRYQFQNQTTALMDLRSGFALSPGGVSLTASTRESGAMVKLNGAAGGPVYLRENGQTRAMTRAVTERGGRGYLPLEPFTIADIGIQPARAQDVTYDQSTERFIVYPGNIMQTERSLREVRIIVGQLSDLNGKAHANAVLTHQGISLGRTDAEGFFQIDASPGDRIIARLPNDETCRFILLEGKPPAGRDEAPPFVQIGQQPCTPD
ncbi:MAG: TcfC E-set like domain-containing protein, partial [Pseudomonadota bacterium]